MAAVIKDGRMPPFRVFLEFDDAVSFVAGQTGEKPERVKQNARAGCPTIEERTGTEWDIE